MVGFPQVLIGMMPASRIGDMHVCPMVTPGVPPIPHVGGPFVKGSPTVLVGMMPQSRVTDTLVCVGPPDVAILGEVTVLVGMAGAGGAGGAMAGVQMMGASVPIQTPPMAGAQATLQPDGTLKTEAPLGSSLPPITLQQPGWPDLPPESTTTFQSVQPVTIPQGTPLYAACDQDADGANSYWSPDPPSANDPPAGDSSGWNSQDNVAVYQVPDPGGMKAWMGNAAGSKTAKSQIWAAASSVASQTIQKFMMPGKG
jgi:uncharacterized Zn-binding protein involved in type VI secretion